MLNLKRTKIGNIDYQAGALKYLANGLPKDFPYVGLSCRLSGRLAVSAGATSGTPWDEAPMSLIRRLRVFGTKKGGAVEIINLDGGGLFEIVHLFGGVKLEFAGISSGGIANYDFVVNIFIPLSVIGLKEEYLPYSLLPGWWFDDLQVEVQWRDGSLSNDGGLISAGDRTLAVTSYGSAAGVPTMSIVGIQALNIDHNVHNPALFKIYKKTLVTEAVEASRKEPLNRGGFYRALLFKAYSDTTSRALSDAILLNAKLLVSGNAKEDWPFLELKAKNKSDYTLESQAAGYALMDFCPNGVPDTMLDTTQFSQNGISLEAELNINGAANNRIDIIAMEVVPAGLW